MRSPWSVAVLALCLVLHVSARAIPAQALDRRKEGSDEATGVADVFRAWERRDARLRSLRLRISGKQRYANRPSGKEFSLGSREEFLMQDNAYRYSLTKRSFK
jgi:hypothetical protein